MEKYTLTNTWLDYILIALALILFIGSCFAILMIWYDNCNYKNICDNCEYDKDKFCKTCGLHEYEKELLK